MCKWANLTFFLEKCIIYHQLQYSNDDYMWCVMRKGLEMAKDSLE